MERWKTGKMENWKDGKVERWKVGLLGKWDIGVETRRGCNCLLSPSTASYCLQLPSWKSGKVEPEILKYLKTHDLMHPCT